MNVYLKDNHREAKSLRIKDAEAFTTHLNIYQDCMYIRCNYGMKIIWVNEIIKWA